HSNSEALIEPSATGSYIGRPAKTLAHVPEKKRIDMLCRAQRRRSMVPLTPRFTPRKKWRLRAYEIADVGFSSSKGVAVIANPRFKPGHAATGKVNNRQEEVMNSMNPPFNRMSIMLGQMRLARLARISLLGLLIAAAAILASPGAVRIARTSAAPMPALRGEAATDYLNQQGLYHSLGEAVKAARYGVHPTSPREGERSAEA